VDVKNSIVRELRAVERFEVSLPVHLSWRVVGRTDQQVQGSTKNISTRGMFVLAPLGPRPGQLLEFEIDMAVDEASPLVLVQGEGEVVRVDPSTKASPLTGFAVRNRWFKLREPEQGQVLLREALRPRGAPARAARVDRRDPPKRGTASGSKVTPFRD
jgi:hypothetical protein